MTEKEAKKYAQETVKRASADMGNTDGNMKFCPHLFAVAVNSDLFLGHTRRFITFHYMQNSDGFEDLVEYYSLCLERDGFNEDDAESHVTELYLMHSFMRCKPNCGCYKSCSHKDGGA